MALDPMLRRAEMYVGRPYIDGEFDCADLAALVQREVFGREILLPQHRHRPQGTRGQVREICRLRDQLADLIDAPETGCGVLLRAAGGDATPWHIGTGYVVGPEVWVLHNSRVMGSAVLQRLNDMHRRGMRLDGFYRWRSAA